MIDSSGVSRREMLAMSAVEVLSLVAPEISAAGAPACNFPIRDGVPGVDYHTHIGDGISVDRALALSKQRGLKFGLLQHAGVKGHDPPSATTLNSTLGPAHSKESRSSGASKAKAQIGCRPSPRQPSPRFDDH